MDFLQSVNKLYLAIPILPLAMGLYFCGPLVMPTYDAYNSNTEMVANVLNAQSELENLKAVKIAREAAEKAKLANAQSADKVIYQPQGLSFGSDASFAPLFEIVIDLAKNSGIRIRSIVYNYSPADDPIVVAKLDGYNVCELGITAVGSYGQFQNFFKGIVREHYLAYLAEAEMKPWENDKSVLITNLKIRLYTKTGNQ